MNTEDSEFERIEREQAMRGVPDAIHHTDTSEPLMYIQGWNDCRQAMLAEQPAQQEPVAWWDAKLGVFDEKHFDQLQPLYTTPQAQPAREWVGLTDEDKCTVELDEAEVDPNWIDGYKSGLKDAEAKLREKNT